MAFVFGQLVSFRSTLKRSLNLWKPQNSRFQFTKWLVLTVCHNIRYGSTRHRLCHFVTFRILIEIHTRFLNLPIINNYNGR